MTIIQNEKVYELWYYMTRGRINKCMLIRTCLNSLWCTFPISVGPSRITPRGIMYPLETLICQILFGSEHLYLPFHLHLNANVKNDSLPVFINNKKKTWQSTEQWSILTSLLFKIMNSKMRGISWIMRIVSRSQIQENNDRKK